MKYSIVIPTYHNAKILERCIGSIFTSHDPKKKEYEIIIVQNGAKEEPNAIATSVFLDSLQTYFGDIVKVIKFDKNEGFCTATNAGMQIAKGDYIVWLNDDTVVSPDWLNRLSKELEKPNSYTDNPGIIGPVSNNVGGIQRLPELEKAKPEDTANIQMSLEREIAKELEQESRNPLKLKSYLQNTNFLSGFCIMMTRKVYETIGDIDEQYSPGGFCDNDYTYRAILAGFGLLIHRGVYIYHQCSVTLDRYFPEHGRGVLQWDKFVTKWKDPNPRKLLLLQRIKIDDELNFNMYKMCVERNKDLVDGVIILSDRSENLDYKDAKDLWGDKLVGFYTNKKDQPFNEYNDKLALLHASWKLKDEYQWCVYLDHDEAFDTGATKQRINKLMNPINPTLFVYGFYYNNYWNSYEYARVDGYWGDTFLLKMWRNIFPPKLQEGILSLNPTGIHTPALPISLPAYNGAAVSAITIDHYGYAESGSNVKKRKFYEELDKSSIEYKKIAVHTSGTYEHLETADELTLIKPTPFTISLNSLCFNEKILYWSVINNYESLIDEAVIIDTGSTDGSIEALKVANFKVIEQPLNDHFAKTRNLAIENSTQKYIMHLDPDEVPQPEYAKKIVKMLIRDPEIAIWHFNNLQKNGQSALTKQPRIFLRDPKFYYNGRVHEVLEESLVKLGRRAKIQDMELMSVNSGFLKADKLIDKKLEFYGRLLELEIKDNPLNAKAHFELALHYKNLGNNERAYELLDKAIALSPKYILAIREKALMKANDAYTLIRSTENMPADPPVVKSLRDIERLLRPLVEAQITVGSANARNNFYSNF